jgi:hypothetical protein
MTEERTTPQAYLGDGVYASFDGYQIWLANHHTNRVIALEPRVLLNLMEFAQMIDTFRIETNEAKD